MKYNCFENKSYLCKPQPGINDTFHFMIFACNYIGISFRVLGYGFCLSVKVRDPQKGRT